MNLPRCSRRHFLRAACGLALISRSVLASMQDTGERDIIVATPLGKLRGTAAQGVRVFRGVPFAAPPVGSLRFRQPQAPAPWSGVRDATQFAPAAMQSGNSATGHAEDCLYLNIWAPDAPGPHPVFVWIHGGGFLGGSASDAISRGELFAREGVIVVTVAYRLGAFGFLELGPLLGKEYSGSANNGLRDLIAALTWVQRNIASFGGDPDRVTVGGESAGAKLTDILLGTPAARPLFQSAISESGGAERVCSRTDAEAVAEAFGAAFHDLTGEQASGISGASDLSLIAAQERFLAAWPRHFPLRPEIDDGLLTVFPIENIRAGSARHKRLLIGTNRDESAFFLGPDPVKEPDARDLGTLSVSAFDEVAAHYATLYPEMQAAQRRIRSVTAEEYWIPSVRVAEAQSTFGDTWMYRLDYTRDTGRFAGEAEHTEDLPLVWDKLPEQAPADEKQLAERVHAAWLAFIKGSAPAADGLPVWPRYNTASRSTMLLDVTSRVEDDPAGAERRLWDGVL